ncbi:MAG: site-specific integrase [Gammaproteobacteria bacterium]|nr:site-specific integrase [Gammaproteobacteria bacterium]
MPELITQITVNSAKPKGKPYDIRDTKVTGFLLRVLPTGKKKYYCQYARGKRKFIKNAELWTPTQAREEAKAILGKAASGHDLSISRAERCTLKTFIDDEYGPWVDVNRKDGDATLKRLKTRFDRFLTQKLSEVGAEDIEKWRTARLKGGTKPATVNRDITTLKATLSKAVEWGMLPINPLASIKPMKIDSRRKVRFLSKEEEKRLRKLLDSKGGRRPKLMKPLILLALNTGMRRGELFHLTWQNANFRTKTITVVGEKAKSGSTRHIPMNAEAVQLLKDWEKISKGELVFPGQDGTPLNNTQKSWATILSDAKIEGFRFHDLRHTFASNLVMAGVDLNTVRDLLGHSDLKMTLRYAHLAPEHKAAAVELLVEGDK